MVLHMSSTVLLRCLALMGSLEVAVHGARMDGQEGVLETDKSIAGDDVNLTSRGLCDASNGPDKYKNWVAPLVQGIIANDKSITSVTDQATRKSGTVLMAMPGANSDQAVICSVFDYASANAYYKCYWFKPIVCADGCSTKNFVPASARTNTQEKACKCKNDSGQGFIAALEKKFTDGADNGGFGIDDSAGIPRAYTKYPDGTKAFEYLSYMSSWTVTGNVFGWRYYQKDPTSSEFFARRFDKKPEAMQPEVKRTAGFPQDKNDVQYLKTGMWC